MYSVPPATPPARIFTELTILNNFHTDEPLFSSKGPQSTPPSSGPDGTPYDTEPASILWPARSSLFLVQQEQAEPVTQKKSRHRMTDRELQVLETIFEHDTHPSRKEKESLASELDL